MVKVVALLVADLWTFGAASYGPACSTELEDKINQNADAMIQKAVNGTMKLEIQRQLYTLTDLENDIMQNYVTERYAYVFEAIDKLNFLLDHELPLPADPPDWYATTLTWAGVGNQFLAVAGTATADPMIAAATVPLGILISSLSAIHSTAAQIAATKQKEAGPKATWAEMLHKWKDEQALLTHTWKVEVSTMKHHLQDELLKDPSMDWSFLVYVVWNAIKQAPGARDWFNGYYAQIINSTQPPVTSGKELLPGKLHRSNANYFVQSTQNGKNYFQGVIFTPQPDSLDACYAVDMVLRQQNNGCWNPSTPGLQGSKGNNTGSIQYPEVPPATAREHIGDFKVLVSVTDTAFFQYDCKDITGANYNAEAIIDKFEGCYDSTEKCCDMLVGCQPCENRFFSRNDKVFLGDKERTCEDFYLKDLMTGEPNTVARQALLDGLKIGGIDFCRPGNYIKPQSDTLGSKTIYPVATVHWDETSLCKECKNTNLLNVFTEHTCENAGAAFKTYDTGPSNKCAVINQPAVGSASGPWCMVNDHKPGFAEHCWGTCGGGCWGNYDEVDGCRTSNGCAFFSTAPLCKKGWTSLSPHDELEPTSDESECSLVFEPYLQCSGSDAEEKCWLTGAEVSGAGSVSTNGTSSTWVSFRLSGLQPFCVNPPDGVENACSVQIHEGTSCSSGVGTVLGSADVETDPYARHLYYPVKSNAVGLIQYQLEPSTAAGKAVVVHDIDGSPMACAVISTSCLRPTTEVTTATPEYSPTPTVPVTTGTTSTTTTSTTTLYTPQQCRPCSTMCAPCQACSDSKSGDCEKCWRCHDYDDDDNDDDDDSDNDCMALDEDHDWNDDEVQCLSETNDDCRLCWQAQLFI